MCAKRYYIATLPVEHINGKMAPVAVTCPNTDDPSRVTHVGFWYGYRVAGRSTSRFGIRTKSRLLTQYPYTPAEIENRTAFADALAAVNTHCAIQADWGLMLAEFRAQRDYISPRGFAVAKCREMGGSWPARWIGE